VSLIFCCWEGEWAHDLFGISPVNLESGSGIAVLHLTNQPEYFGRDLGAKGLFSALIESPLSGLRARSFSFFLD